MYYLRFNSRKRTRDKFSNWRNSEFAILGSSGEGNEAPNNSDEMGEYWKQTDCGFLHLWSVHKQLVYLFCNLIFGIVNHRK